MQIIDTKLGQLSLAILLLIAPVLASQAKEAQQPNLVLRETISTVDSHDGLIADVIIPANASMPRHQHPGDEFLYMLDGQVELSRDGLETIILKSGQGYRIPAGTIHTPKAGADGARAIVFRVHPQGYEVTNIIEGEDE